MDQMEQTDQMDQQVNKVKSILCYGDSNTWGYVPAENGARFPSHIRWPGVLAKTLGAGYRVIEEGLCGRTTVFDDPFAPGVERNGLKIIGTILDSHKPLDLVVIFLGTNDLKTHFGAIATDIAKGAELVAKFAARPDFGPGENVSPEVLVVVPPSIWEVPAAFGPAFKGGREKSTELPDAFNQMSKRSGFPILYSEDIVHSDALDGIHLSAESHGVLGERVAMWVMERMGG